MIFDPVRFWSLLGIALIIFELLIPGLVVIFLGFGALFVSLMIHLGLISSWYNIMTTWFVSSLVLIFSLRNFFAKLAPGETSKANMNEDLDAIGKIVDVHQDVHPYDDKGRIFFRGTTWSASCPHTSIKAGGKARLIKREGNTWIVEEITEDEIAKENSDK